ncbi:MAG: serine hydrolase [Candidatus Hydrogenedentes bacterium]|nr:serine hydrolase [Candidatus Hydrogenedentota bacterium]
MALVSTNVIPSKPTSRFRLITARFATVFALVCLALIIGALVYRNYTPLWTTTWPRFENPASVGVDTTRLDHGMSLAKDAGASAVVVIFRGRLLAANGRPAVIFPCHSVRKSYVSALFGQAVTDGKVSLDATLAQLGIDDMPPLTSQEKSATVRQLLQARSGVYHDSNAASERMRGSLPARDSVKPGERWVYQNWDFNALGTIFKKATGTDVFEAFDEQIAKPLGMEHFDRSKHCHWITGDASQHAAYEFRMSALDMARFGQLMLQGGNWNGKQIVPSAWVVESTRPYSTVDDGKAVKDLAAAVGKPAYGYMWWIGTVAAALGNPPGLEGSYSAEGVGGHMIAICPDLELVIVVRANTWLPAWTPFIPTRVNNKKLVPAIREMVEAIRPAAVNANG